MTVGALISAYQYLWCCHTCVTLHRTNRNATSNNQKNLVKSVRPVSLCLIHMFNILLLSSYLRTCKWSGDHFAKISLTVYANDTHSYLASCMHNCHKWHKPNSFGLLPARIAPCRLWKHASFPAHLRPNWCQHHTSEGNFPPPPYESLYEKYVTGWEGIQKRVTIVILDSISIDSMRKYEAVLGLFFPCFTTHWRTLSFIASESILAAIQWDLKIFQWRNPYGTLDVTEVSHAYLGLAWAMLNMSQKCYYADGSIIRITTVPRNPPRGWSHTELDTVCADSKNSCLAPGAYHTNWPCRWNGREKWSYKDSLHVHSQARTRNHIFWIMGQYPLQNLVLQPARARSNEAHHRHCEATWNPISEISPVPEDSQKHSLCTASATFNPC